MIGYIILLYIITKVGLVLILTLVRFWQYNVIKIQTAKKIGDVVVVCLLWGILSGILEGLAIILIMGSMIISTTLFIDYSFAVQLKIDDRNRKKKLFFAQALSLIEISALILAYQNGYWGGTELILLKNLSHLHI